MDPLSVFAAVLGGAGKLFEGESNAQLAELQRRIAEGNADLLQKQAEITRMGADTARSKGTLEQSRLGERVAATEAAQTARFSASGLDPRIGSPLLAQAFSAAQGQADAAIIRAGTAQEVAGALTNAANIEGKAAESRWQVAALQQKAFASRVAGYFGAGTSFLKAASPDKWAALG
jgi:hypothetical protein